VSHERDRNVEDGGKRERRNKEGGGILRNVII